MLSGVTFGQYFPGATVVHKLDPRIKLILTVVYIAALFTAKGLPAYLLMFATLLTCLYLSKIKPTAALRCIRPILIILLFTTVLHIFFTGGEPLVSFLGLTISKEGIYAALYMSARLVMLIIGTFMLTYTTSPIALTDGLESMLNPLKKIKLPVHELAMMMSIALRFIPTLIEETGKIISAQKARGAAFETGNLIKRARAILPIIIPLFVSAIRRADELAVAMESRCYHGGEGRTRMKILKTARRDYAAMACGVVVFAAVVVLRRIEII